MTERDPRKHDRSPGLAGTDVHGVTATPSDARNRAWDGREPYPQDVGGINHPGHGGEVGRDPLTGDRGSGEQERGNRETHFNTRPGEEAVPQQGRPYSAGEAQASDPSHTRYAEGGFEPRGAFRGWDSQGHAEHARGWWSRAQDEVRSWMGDHDAERRLRHDHEVEEFEARGGGDWKGHDDDTAWRDPVRDADAKPSTGEAPREHRPGLFRDEQGR